MASDPVLRVATMLGLACLKASLKKPWNLQEGSSIEIRIRVRVRVRVRVRG